MSWFLNPGFLWFLLLLGPVIAVHFIRSRPVRRSVPTNRIWRIVVERLRPNSLLQKFQHSLLLLFQLFAITVAVLATARPTVPGAGGMTRVVILDVSASMQAVDVQPSRFEQARQRAEKLLTSFRGRVSLLQLSDKLEMVVSPIDDCELAKKALFRLAPTHCATPHPDRVLHQLRDLEGLAADEIIVLTDTLDLNVADDFMPQTAFSVEIFGCSGNNVAIIEGEGAYQPNSGQLHCSVTLFNYNETTVSVQLRPLSGTFSGFPLTLAVPAFDRLQVALPPVATTSLALVIEEAVDLNFSQADDVWYFSETGLRPKILLEAPHRSPLWRLQQALPFLDMAPLQDAEAHPDALAWLSTRPTTAPFLPKPGCLLSAGSETVLPGEILPYPTDHPLLRFTDWDAVPVAALGADYLAGLPLIRTVRATLLSEELRQIGDVQVPLLYAGVNVEHPELADSIFLPVFLYNTLEYLLRDRFPRITYPVGHPSLHAIWQGRAPRIAGIHHPPDGHPQRSFAINLQSPSEARLALGQPIQPNKIQTQSRELKEQTASFWEIFLCGAIIFILGEWYVFLRRY